MLEKCEVHLSNYICCELVSCLELIRGNSLETIIWMKLVDAM